MHQYGQAHHPHSVGIVGARGYSGLELARILLQHPQAALASCFSDDASFKLSEYLPESAAASVSTLPMGALTSAIDAGMKTVFLATPAEVSMKLAPQCLKAGADVIDLSGAFRLKKDPKSAYPKWYGHEHPQPELNEGAVYGLAPFYGPISAHGPTLVANPGCYATAVLMALIPLLKSKVVQADSLVIDAKSGTSGGGRKAAENLLFTEVEGECLPYKVGKHQHLPEICEALQAFAGSTAEPFFTTHLIPVRRGIICCLYAKLAKGMSLADVEQAYAKAYAGYPLLKHGKLAGLSNAAANQALSLKRVAGTARTHIHFHAEGEKLFVFSLIDNLMKGAASQAVENFNRLNDLPLLAGLSQWEGVL